MTEEQAKKLIELIAQQNRMIGQIGIILSRITVMTIINVIMIVLLILVVVGIFFNL